MVRVKQAVVLCLIVLLAAGCVRTEEFNRQVEKDLPQDIQRVQTALDEYMKHTPVLPIKEAPAGVHLYQKYVVDFSKMQSVIDSPPATSFGKGGHYIYVIVNPGKEPEVRVMDLRLIEKVRDLQSRVDAYRREQADVPKDKKEGPNLYSLDFKALGEEPWTIPSPYSSRMDLPILVDEKGKVYLDYRKDVMQKLEQAEEKPPESKDLRRLLYKDSIFVPVFSPPIRLEDGDPVFRADR
ncbi:hypothetical protein [Paludifilum halophilum]|uniref:Lipoprotein n=1 Tax=Paludifilum halophilum TaxID=1642702 RepID=A0A235BDQ4_9BACL|nr:hypothetical protein [Paludifilum halophilum]OYD09725.1 hypothetical protein CHM34_01640 [Paludifilum halophilum]